MGQTKPFSPIIALYHHSFKISFWNEVYILTENISSFIHGTLLKYYQKKITLSKAQQVLFLFQLFDINRIAE